MKVCMDQQPGFRRSYLPAVVLTLVLLVSLITTGCVSEKECSRRVSEAVANEQAVWAEIVKGLKADNDQQEEQFTAEISRLKAQAEQERLATAIANHQRGAAGLNVDVYENITVPSLVSRIVFWVAFVLIVALVVALGIWLVRDESPWNQWSKLLMVPLAVYVFLRFASAITGEGFRVAILHDGFMEAAGLLAGFTCIGLFDLYRQAQRRLVLDLLGVALCIFALLATLELVLFNHEVLMVSGATFALRLTVCPLLGAVVYVIGNAIKTSAQRHVGSNVEI